MSTEIHHTCALVGGRASSPALVAAPAADSGVYPSAASAAPCRTRASDIRKDIFTHGEGNLHSEGLAEHDNPQKQPS